MNIKIKSAYNSVHSGIKLSSFFFRFSSMKRLAPFFGSIRSSTPRPSPSSLQARASKDQPVAWLSAVHPFRPISPYRFFRFRSPPTSHHRCHQQFCDQPLHLGIASCPTAAEDAGEVVVAGATAAASGAGALAVAVTSGVAEGVVAEVTSGEAGAEVGEAAAAVASVEARRMPASATFRA